MGVTISGVGCSLIDYLYTNVDFDSDSFRRYSSVAVGDGGLSPGKLVFSDEFEKFSGVDFHRALRDCTGGKEPETLNLGGPAIVALINAAQLLHDTDSRFNFYGAMADDESGHHIVQILKGLPVNTDNYRILEGETPTTVVLSDPSYHEGSGERTFINTIGVAGSITPDDLGDHFFDAEIVLFGGTGLMPQVHDGLTGLSRKAQANDCLTIVNTVFDFRSEKNAPDKRWPLGESDETYENIDLLIVDREEGMRMSGTATPGASLRWFRDHGVDSAIVTCGAQNYHLYSGGRYFTELELQELPVSKQIRADIDSGAVSPGDTTGCGDNFVGGVLASVAEQYESGGSISLLEAASWGVASGGQACLYIGGTYIEGHPGEKRALIERYYEHYRRQVNP